MRLFELLRARPKSFQCLNRLKSLREESRSPELAQSPSLEKKELPYGLLILLPLLFVKAA